MEIVITEKEKFLDLTGVPSHLRLRSKLGRYMFRRDCYDDFIDDICKSLPKIKLCKAVAILGTAGIGKSSLFMLLLKKLIENPIQFGLQTKSFYHQTRPDTIMLYQYENGNIFSCRSVPVGEFLDESIILFVDMETMEGSPNEHAGISLIFTSFRASHYKELTKNGWQKVMPTWSANEQAEYFNSPQFEADYGVGVAERAYGNISFYGGSIRNNIMAALKSIKPEEDIKSVIERKGALICDCFFTAGFGGKKDEISDVLVHRNPQIVNEKYDYDATPYVYSFASPYILRRLLQLKDTILVTKARHKYSTGTCSGSDNGKEFELLCLHGFKISGVEFIAKPLSEGTQGFNVSFPPKQVLALNWRQQESYLQANILYIPPYGNLESRYSFCLIEINERWTLVILQCTIAETHPVKQNGVKIIYDCYKTNPELKVEDTVIIFMIPLNSKLNRIQSLVTKKKDGVLEEVQRVTISITAQYKIENELVDIDDI